MLHKLIAYTVKYEEVSYKFVKAFGELLCDLVQQCSIMIKMMTLYKNELGRSICDRSMCISGRRGGFVLYGIAEKVNN